MPGKVTKPVTEALSRVGIISCSSASLALPRLVWAGEGESGQTVLPGADPATWRTQLKNKLRRSDGDQSVSKENGGKMKTIKQILRLKGKEIWITTPDATVFEALKVLAEKDIGAIPVLDGKKLIGIFSERDYARKVILKGKSSKKTLVSEIMSTTIIIIPPDHTTAQGLALMTAKHVRHLPVIQKQKLVGFISIGDLVKSIMDEQKQVIDKMEQYITETSGLN